jgi:hypothetical protein
VKNNKILLIRADFCGWITYHLTFDWKGDAALVFDKIEDADYSKKVWQKFIDGKI